MRSEHYVFFRLATIAGMFRHVSHGSTSLRNEEPAPCERVY
jgi:hypothetical protein